MEKTLFISILTIDVSQLIVVYQLIMPSWYYVLNLRLSIIYHNWLFFSSSDSWGKGTQNPHLKIEIYIMIYWIRLPNSVFWYLLLLSIKVFSFYCCWGHHSLLLILPIEQPIYFNFPSLLMYLIYSRVIISSCHHVLDDRKCHPKIFLLILDYMAMNFERP